MIRRVWFCLLLIIASCAVRVPPVSATLNEITSANRYVGNGSTTVFAYTFRVLVKTDIEVLVNGVVKTVDTDYTVSGLGASGGGSVTFSAAPANAATVTVLRKQPVSQDSDYVANEAFPAERLEKDLDKLAMQNQQQKEALDRAIKLPKTSTLSGIDFPIPGADKYIKWNAAGTALEAASGGSGAGGLPSDPTACPSGLYVTDQNEVGTLTCAQPSFSQLSGAATDAQIPDTITVNTAVTATTAAALTANGTNCTSGQAARGVDASGNAEDCFIPTVTQHNVLSTTHPDSAAASPVLGDLIHGNTTPAWARLAGNTTTTKQFLSQTGTGSVSAVPGWSALADADIPNTITIDLAATATALAANNANCSAGQYAAGVDASGAAEGCAALTGTSRAINTTSPLAGGGDLTADRTITCTTCTTNASALTVDQVVVGNGGQTTKTLAAGTNSYVLTMSGGIPAWSSPGAPSGHNILSASHSDTVAASVVLGDILYGNSTPAWQRLAGNTTTTKKFFTQTGTGAVSAGPGWNTIVAGDLPAGFVDATTDLATGLCSDGQILKKASGVWSCGSDTTGTGLSTLNGLTSDPQTFAVGSSGTDFNISSVTSTHTFNIPSASTSNRGLVTTGAQTFSGIKTIPGIVVSGTPAIGLDLSGGIFSSFSIKDITGDSIYFWDQWPGKAWELARGTAGSPITVGGPLVKISKTFSHTKSACNNIDLNGECSAAMVLNVKNLHTGSGSLTVGLHIGVETKANNLDTFLDGDAIPLVAQGRATAGNRFGMGAMLEGIRYVNTAAMMALEAKAQDYSSSDCGTIGGSGTYAWGPNEHSRCVAIMANVQGATSGRVFDAILQLASFNNAKAKSAIVINEGTARDYSIHDAASGGIGYYFSGNHSVAGIYFGTGTYGTGIDFGAATYSSALIQFGPSFQGGGNRVLCVSNTGGIYRGSSSEGC